MGSIVVHRVSVRSSNLKEVGYDPAERILEVEFHDGGVYQYRNVSAAIHKNLMNARSKGEYLERAIKNGGFPYTRLK